MDDQIKNMLIFIATKVLLGALKIAGIALIVFGIAKLFGAV